jgi:hypothetical protein
VEAAVSIGLPRRLLAVWLVLVALLTVIALLEYDERTQTQPEDDTLLLPIPVSELAAIEMGAAGALHRFERDAGGAWFYHGSHAASEAAHAHQPDAAAAQRIGAAFEALGRTRIERRLPYDRNSQQYGVATPPMVLLLYRKGDARPIAQYAVGDVAPDTFSRYLHRVGAAEVVTIPNYQVENLLGLLQSFAPRTHG